MVIEWHANQIRSDGVESCHVGFLARRRRGNSRKEGRGGKAYEGSRDDGVGKAAEEDEDRGRREKAEVLGAMARRAYQEVREKSHRIDGVQAYPNGCAACRKAVCRNAGVDMAREMVAKACRREEVRKSHASRENYVRTVAEGACALHLHGEVGRWERGEAYDNHRAAKLPPCRV